MGRKLIKTGLLVVGAWLVVTFVAATVATAAPAASGGTSLEAAGPANTGVRVCQRPRPPCRLRCRTIVLRKRCRPGMLCRFKSHVVCRCFYQRGRCWLRCRASRLVVRRCNRRGWCRAAVRRCQCGVPMVPPRPPR